MISSPEPEMRAEHVDAHEFVLDGGLEACLFSFAWEEIMYMPEIIML